MMYFLILIIGLGLGIYLKDFVPKFIQKYLVVQKNNYKVKFNVYFIIHRNNSRLNEIIRTETIEISVLAKDENEIDTLISDLVDDGIRFEIENIERV